MAFCVESPNIRSSGTGRPPPATLRTEGENLIRKMGLGHWGMGNCRMGEDSMWDEAVGPVDEQQPNQPNQIPAPGDADGVIEYTFYEIIQKTNTFANKIGEGRVYWGLTPIQGLLGKVAIKQLSNRDSSRQEFVEQATRVSRLRNKHTVKLIGYCAYGVRRYLVSTFIFLGSLDKLLHGGIGVHSWKVRLTLAAGVAQGLHFLHGQQVVYGGLSSSNILLGGAHVAMLNLAVGSLFPAEQVVNGSVIDWVMQTEGYGAPECASNGKHTFESDVYCYGVFLFEMVTGKRPIDTIHTNGRNSVIDKALEALAADGSKRLFALVDERVLKTLEVTSVRRVLATALRCVESDPTDRPKMNEVMNVIMDMERETDAAASSTSTSI